MTEVKTPTAAKATKAAQPELAATAPDLKDELLVRLEKLEAENRQLKMEGEISTIKTTLSNTPTDKPRQIKGLHLVVTRKYNAIPQKWIPTMPPIGTVVEFEFLNKQYDPHGVGGKPEMRPKWHYPIPQFDRFKDLEENRWIQIGILQGEDENGRPDITMEMRKMMNQFPYQQGNILAITIGESLLTDMLYQYLMLASFVEDNMLTPEMRDLSRRPKPTLRYINRIAQAEKELEERRIKRQAIRLAEDMDDLQIERAAYIFGIDTIRKGASSSERMRLIRNDVERISESRPSDFIARTSDSDIEVKAICAQGIAKGILFIDTQGKWLRFNDAQKGEVLQLVKTDIDSVCAQYAESLKSRKDFKLRHDTIVGLLDGK